MLPLGIVFDLDGTLVLSHHDFGRMREGIIQTAEKYGAARHSISWADLIGTSQVLDAARRQLRAIGVSAEDISRFDEEVARLFDAVEMEAVTRTTARAGAPELLQKLRDRGVRLGLFTRSSERFCTAALSHTGLAGFFRHMRTRSAPGPAKPSPEALHLLLGEMGVPAGRALFVGDHVEDARCATSAGVRFYAVLPDPAQPNPTTAEHFFAVGAALVAPDLRAIARLLDAHSETPARSAERRRR